MKNYNNCHEIIFDSLRRNNLESNLIFFARTLKVIPSCCKYFTVFKIPDTIMLPSQAQHSLLFPKWVIFILKNLITSPLQPLFKMARNLFEICKSKVISDSGSIFTHIGRRTPVRPFYGLLLFCFCYDQMWTSDDPNRVHLKHLEKHRMFEQIPFIKPVILLISYFQILL